MQFKPEEFVVEEIASDGSIIQRDQPFQRPDSETGKKWHAHFALQKTVWTTNDALRALAWAVHAKPSRFSFAGAKDRNAVTTQLCSGFCVEPKALVNARVKDLRVLGAWKEKEKIRLGDLKGNCFTITLTAENAGVEPDPEKIRERTSTGRYPNFFGPQRFGSVRTNTALVGLKLLRGETRDAVMNYLTFTEGEKSVEAREARERLAKEGDCRAALEYFPKWLKNERFMLEWLAKNENDFAGALRCLPRGLQLMFVHAVQSQLFNDELASGPPREEGNLVGYETAEPTRFEEEWLRERGLSKESFLLKSFPELSSKGGKRKWFAELREFQVLQEDPLVVRFSLDAGCYATEALYFLMGLNP